MNFSPLQWAALVALDFFVRAFWFVVWSFNWPLAVAVAPRLSVIHLAVFAAASFCVNLLKLRRTITLIVSLAITNVLFVGLLLFVEVSEIIEHRATACGAVHCKWIDGVITPLGRQALAQMSIEQVAINIVLVLAVSAFARYRARARIDQA
jgi:hypothetical protein